MVIASLFKSHLLSNFAADASVKNTDNNKADRIWCLLLLIKRKHAIIIIFNIYRKSIKKEKGKQKKIKLNMKEREKEKEKK